MCKKAISVLLSLMIIIAVITAVPVYASAETSGDFEYQILEDGTAEIIGYNGRAYDMIIPSEIDGYTVTSIGDYAFYYYIVPSNIDSVEIPETITYIGTMAFYNFNSLYEVAIPDSVATIGKYAFGYAFSYDYDGEEVVEGIRKTSLTISGALNSEAQRYAVDNGFNFTAIYDNYSLNFLDNSTISVYYLGVENDLIVPNEIAGYTVTEFRGCGESVKSITLPESVTEFNGGSSLENIYVDESNSIYSSIDGVLYNKDKTEIICYPKARKGAFEIPDTVNKINGAFFNCTGLTSVTLPDGLERIGQSTFYQCINLKSVVIPDSVTVIGWNAFNGCSSLESVTLPSGLTEIPSRLFMDCTSLKNIKLPKGVTTIDGFAFSGCSSLESIVIPDEVKEIPYGCFADCNNLKRVVLGKSVETIGDWALSCPALEDIYFPDTLRYVGSGSLFGGCPWYDNQPDGVIYAGKLALVYKGGCPSKVTLKAGTKAINRSCFYGCEELENVVIPNSVEYIGKSAFYGCEKLKSVIVPKSVTKIEEYSFGYTNETVYDEQNYYSYDIDVRIDGFVIYGYKDTEAERYAKENEISFVALEENTELLGDTDGDGKITIIDATYIQRYLVHLKVLSFYAELADVNGDGIDITDATYIQRKIAEIEISYPVGEPINKT